MVVLFSSIHDEVHVHIYMDLTIDVDLSFGWSVPSAWRRYRNWPGIRPCATGGTRLWAWVVGHLMLAGLFRILGGSIDAVAIKPAARERRGMNDLILKETNSRVCNYFRIPKDITSLNPLVPVGLVEAFESVNFRYFRVTLCGVSHLYFTPRS